MWEKCPSGVTSFLHRTYNNASLLKAVNEAQHIRIAFRVTERQFSITVRIPLLKLAVREMTEILLYT